MQATGHLPFSSMLSAVRLHGRLCICLLLWCSEPGIPGEVASAILEKSLLEKSNSSWQSTRQATGHLLYILYWRSRSLVQLNVAYVSTTLCQSYT